MASDENWKDILIQVVSEVKVITDRQNRHSLIQENQNRQSAESFKRIFDKLDELKEYRYKDTVLAGQSTSHLSERVVKLEAQQSGSKETFRYIMTIILSGISGWISKHFGG